MAAPLSGGYLRLRSGMILGALGDLGYRRKPFAYLWADDGDALGIIYLVEGVIDYPSFCFSDKLCR